MFGDTSRVMLVVWDALSGHLTPPAAPAATSEENGRGLFIAGHLSDLDSYYPPAPYGGKVMHASLPKGAAPTNLRDSALSVVYGQGILRISLTWGFAAGSVTGTGLVVHPAGAGSFRRARRGRRNAVTAGCAWFARVKSEERPGSGRLRVTTPCNHQDWSALRHA